jgi:hypothetical protein
MPAKRKGSSNANAQLPLGIEDSEQSAALLCRGIFSLNYLQQHFAKSEGFPTLEEAGPIYERLKKRWLEDYVGMSRRKEAYTRTQFLDPLLKEIGWTFIPEQDLPSTKAIRKRPDYCLFLDDETRQRAAKETDAADVFREAKTVLEAKKVQHSLDEVGHALLWIGFRQRRKHAGRDTKCFSLPALHGRFTQIMWRLNLVTSSRAFSTRAVRG